MRKAKRSGKGQEKYFPEPVKRENARSSVSISHFSIKPIFIYSGFRSSSTWFWSKFRNSENCVAFYEYFNEVLVDISTASILNTSPEKWDSHHPDIGPYFLEYMSFVKDSGGIGGFKERFAYECFMPSANDAHELSESEIDYMSSLINFALQSGRTPVLSDPRALGRASAIRNKFSGVQILLIRNLFAQWNSCVEQYNNGNTYFVDSLNRIIKFCCGDSYLSQVYKVIGCPSVDENPEHHLILYTIVNSYLMARAADSADLIVDMELLHADTAYQRATGAEIRRLTGVTIDLSDVRDPFSACGLRIRKLIDIRAILTVLMRPALDNLSSEGGVLFQKLISRLLSDIETYAKYTDYIFSINQISTLANAPSAEYRGAALLRGEAESVSLHRQLIQAEAERSALQEQFTQADAERVSLHHQLIQAEAERSMLQEQFTQADAERVSLHHQLIQAEAERSVLQEQFAQADAERVSLHHQLTQAEAERSVLQEQFTQADAERVSLHHQLIQAEAERSAVQEQFAQADAERVNLRNQMIQAEAEHCQLKRAAGS